MLKKHRTTLVLLAAALLVFGAVAIMQNRQRTKRAENKSAAAEAANYETPRPRIISLLPSLTEMLCLLGLEEHIVARSQYCDYPESVLDLPVVGSHGNANIEAIVRLKPDFVVMSDLDSQSKIHEALAKWRVSHLGYRAMSLNDIIDTAWDFGQRFDVAEGAAIWMRYMDKVKSDAQAAAPADTPRVLFCAGRDPGSLDRIYISGRGNFYEEIVKICGGENAYDGTFSTPMISAEGLLKMNPDIIFDVLAGATEAEVRQAIEGWGRLTSVNAVKNGRVHILTESWAARPGPRVDMLIEYVSEKMKNEK